MRSGSGIEWLVDASGCDARLLIDRKGLTGLIESVVRTLTLTAVGQIRWHRFPKSGGLTGVLVLRESHITCHTYPEKGLAAINVYVCRRRKGYPWRRELRERLKAQSVWIRRVLRSGL